jgi:ABC-type multidrug transport system ATPase subunit
MIVSAAFTNFLALRDVQIDLEPFTVIVGPNACGKSTVLEGLYRLCGMRRGYVYSLIEGGETKFPESLNQGFHHPSDILSREASSLIRFVAKVRKFDHESDFKVIFKNFAPRKPNSSFGDVTIDIPYAPIKHTHDLISIPSYSDAAFQAMREFPVATMLRLNGSRMAKASYSPLSQPYLESDGGGLATICEILQDEYPEIFTSIQESLRSVIPSVKLFRLRRKVVQKKDWFNLDSYMRDPNQANKGDEAVGKELIFDFDDASDIPAASVSEGTLITLAILVAAAGRSDDQLVLLDDLERGLHPRAIRDLIQALRGLQQTNPNLQIVATTHSPYILNRLEPKEVRVARLEPGHGTLIAKLEEAPNFEQWSKEMLPGELWSNVGEDWVQKLK